VAKGIIGVPKSFIKGAKRIDEEVDIKEELRPATPRRRFRDRFRKSESHEHDWFTTSSSSSSSSSDAEHAEHNKQHKRSIPRDVAHGIKKSGSKIVRSSVRAPLDVSLAIAQGFHNAPRLYGDEVRHPMRITGLHSGMRAAGKELALGIYDGFTGLITQPYHGAKDEGVKGALKGVGKGVGGMVFKTQAGFAGVIGYSLKGIHREARKNHDRKVLERIMRTRRFQGSRELAQFRRGAGAEAEEVMVVRMREGWQKVLEERRKNTERETKLGRELAELNARRKNRKRKQPVLPKENKEAKEEGIRECGFGVVEGDQCAMLPQRKLGKIAEESGGMPLGTQTTSGVPTAKPAGENGDGGADGAGSAGATARAVAERSFTT